MLLYQPSRLQASLIERHRHTRSYATVVLSGHYEEAGDAGRFRVESGDVLLHRPFSAHLDRVSSHATTVLDLPLPLGTASWPAKGRIADPDELVRLSQSDRRAAVEYVLDEFLPVRDEAGDLPDLLAKALGGTEPPAIAGWADAAGRTREHVSRAFRKVYGVSPARYRCEARARNAWQMIVGGDARLADIAADTGFADQAHMARAIRSLTGSTPTLWRKWKHRTPSQRGRKGDTPTIQI